MGDFREHDPEATKKLEKFSGLGTLIMFVAAIAILFIIWARSNTSGPTYPSIATDVITSKEVSGVAKCVAILLITR